jgi:hypothetical protein
MPPKARLLVRFAVVAVMAPLVALGCERIALRREPALEAGASDGSPAEVKAAPPDAPDVDAVLEPDAAPTSVDVAPPPGDARSDAGAPTCALADTTGGWLGCRSACSVCKHLVEDMDLYAQRHPGCTVSAESCDGAYRPCGAACPIPSPADWSCSPVAGGWPGCVGSGCAVDPALVAAYPGYLRGHRACTLAPSMPDSHVGCSALCPAPGEADRMVRDGSGDWDGCRGYGLWVCVELLDGYPRYFSNHPLCVPNPTCEGAHLACNEACPAPGPADR